MRESPRGLEREHQEIIEASSSVSAGKQAESFSYSLIVKTRAISFKKSDLNNFINGLIGIEMQGADKKIEEQSLKIDYSADKTDLESGKIILNIKISAKLYSNIDQDLVRKALSGKSIKESRTLLDNQPAIIKTEFNVFPPGLINIPENSAKLKIKLNID